MGAVGRPGIPDHVTLWGLLLTIRQRLDLWANVRPVRLLEGVPCALAGRGPADIDMLFVRENSEGEYSGVGGRAHQGQALEVGIETSVFTRAGVERVVEHAFAARPRAARPASRARPSRTPRASATCSGTRSPPRSQSAIPTSATSTCSSTRSRRAWCCGPTASTSSSRPTSSATSSPTSAPRCRAAWAWRRARTCARAARLPASSSRCTARRPTSPARASRTRAARSGAPC